MMKTGKLLLTALAFMAQPGFSHAGDKAIYGQDNRLDYYEAPADMQALADSVVSLWKSDRVVEKVYIKKYHLTVKPLSELKNLCPSERFRDQDTGAFCSGSLVGEDLVMTAGHCMRTEADCAGTRLVFGFKVAKAGGPGTSSIPKGEVYACASIVKTADNFGADYALIKLDRKVTAHKPLAINRAGGIAKGAGVFVIGHPSGMPLKIAGGAAVRNTGGKTGFFFADLDAFGGNSGSPVFNQATKKVEGILARGGEDYRPTPAGCKVAMVKDQAEGAGEVVNRVSDLAAFIPDLPGIKAGEEVIAVAPVGRAKEAAPVMRVGFD